MYHPPSKRKQIIQRSVTYTFMSIAVIALVTALVFVMLGYQFNENDGRIEQGGLVQFDSRPTGANVTIDGADFGTRTPSKTTLDAGQHIVTMGRSGYETWQKSVAVTPGSVLWLNYARLIPSDLQQTNVADFKKVASTAVSPDAKWMAIQEHADKPAIHLADLTQDTVKLDSIELPAATYTSPQESKNQRFELVKWDPDNRYVLVKHTYDDAQREWLVVDTERPAASQNVTKLLDIDASRVVFSGDNNKILYAQIGTDVRRINLDDATMSKPLVSNVAEFAIYDKSTIVFTTLLDDKTKKRSAGYYTAAADKIYTVRSYQDDGKKPLRVAIGEYFGDTYVALAYGNKIEISKGALTTPSKLSQVASMSLPGGAKYLSTATKGRFVVAQKGGTYAVYDMELEKATTTKLKGDGAVKRELRWLDDYMLWSDRDGMLRLYEFDGANQHDIMPVVPGFSATLSQNSRYLYGITKSDDGGYHLGRVRMILP